MDCCQAEPGTEYEEDSSKAPSCSLLRKKRSSLTDQDTRRSCSTKDKSFEAARRRASSVNKKAFSAQCALEDAIVADLLRSPSVSTLAETPKGDASDNVCVRSMSFDTQAERLSHLEAAAFAVILREAADALEVLKRTLVVQAEPPRSRPERRVVRRLDSCAAEDEKKMYFGEDAGFGDVVPSVNEKLTKDRDLVFNVFRKVACELEKDGRYEWLRCEVDSIVDNKEKEDNLNVNLKIWSDLAMKLRNALNTTEDEFQMFKKKCTDEINDLNAQIDASYCNNNEKLDYVIRWEASRLEQQNLRQKVQEDALLEEIRLLEKSRKKHLKVSAELQTFGKQAIDSTEEEIMAWSTRYNDELERRTQETNDLQDKIEEIKEFIEEQLELQKDRQELINEYMGDQLKMQAEAEYWNEIHKAATLIQAQWRGYMVRHQLGKYAEIFRKAKKNKNKKKKKGKKKGKAKKKDKTEE